MFVHTSDSWFIKNFGIELSPRGPWVAGGAALNWYRNRPTVSDIDVFFASEEQYIKTKMALEKILRGTQSEDKDDWLEFNSAFIWTPYETENAITYIIENADLKTTRGKIQLIKKNFFKTPEEVVKSFDISVCQIATDGDKIWTGEHFVKDVESKTLRFLKITESSAQRYIKYCAYGFYPAPNTLNDLLNADNVRWERVEGEDQYA